MSGFVAVLATGEAAPAAAATVRRRTEALRYRAPDGSRTWQDARIALGHARLATGCPRLDAPQPVALGDRLRLAGDVRVDAQADLRRALAARDERVAAGAPDALLVLHAYRALGERCVEHLLGDFAFALWDADRQRLLLARDRFGVRPLYWCESGGRLLASNTLAALRAARAAPDAPDDVLRDDAPACEDSLDDGAVADFLMFGYAREPDATAFARIRRLPPAHLLTATPGTAAGGHRVAIRRYWDLPLGAPIRCRDPREHVERFRTLLDAAVSDRLRGGPTVVMMSGGLDSTSVAASASALRARTAGPDVRACTLVHDGLLADDEARYAGEVAAALGIEATTIPVDDGAAFPGAGALRAAPEPSEDPVPASDVARLRAAAGDARVVLTGQGGDPGLAVARGWWLHALRRGRPDHVVADALLARRLRGRLPPLYVRTHLERRRGERHAHPPGPPFPPWLAPALVERLHLRARFAAAVAVAPAPDCARPEAHADLRSPAWARLFEDHDAGTSGLALDVRHPFFDARLLEFLLRLPPVPWCLDKALLREAMRGRLPEVVRLRPKCAVAGHPARERLRAGGVPALPRRAVRALARYVDIPRYLALAANVDRLRPGEIGLVTRPLGLALWLERSFADAHGAIHGPH